MTTSSQTPPDPGLALAPPPSPESDYDLGPDLPRSLPPSGTSITLELPTAVLAAGKGTKLNFFLAHASFVKSLRWAPGFKLERLVLGPKDFGDGTTRVDGKPYHEHRVLKADRVELHVLNATDQDRTFGGLMTVEIAHVVADEDYSCGLDPEPEAGAS